MSVKKTATRTLVVAALASLSVLLMGSRVGGMGGVVWRYLGDVWKWMTGQSPSQ